MRNIQLPPPSASDLMLDILSGYGPQGLSVQALCKAGRVMDIAETNVRVALNRLTNQMVLPPAVSAAPPASKEEYSN